ncbi:hypothetical protein COLO4_15306 [Corchorus olitorius]|uniref:Uncharacterized protein n=1 Tax=Corchorus olitorius TaxID=93759 RepID=A0A1R3JNB3_9ROSI|nr:hypothetical protein COLO4_15306 [Corchorus olitorius]
MAQAILPQSVLWFEGKFSKKLGSTNYTVMLRERWRRRRATS